MLFRWGINLTGEKKAQLAAECFGGIVFTTVEEGDQIKKVSFKIVESPEGGAITLGVANASLFKDRNFEINYGTNYAMQRVKLVSMACVHSDSCLKNWKEVPSCTQWETQLTSLGTLKRRNCFSRGDTVSKNVAQLYQWRMSRLKN